MWQEIAVIIIVILTVGYIIYKTYHYFIKPPSPCDDCDGCALKDELKGNKTTCKDFKSKGPLG